MSMLHSLESRVPFLDRAMLELTRRIPPRLRLRGMTTKYLLRRAMADRLPAADRQREEARLQRADAGMAGGRAAGLHAGHRCRPSGSGAQGLFKPAAIERIVSDHLGPPARS